MKVFINKCLLNFWVFKHITKSYWRYCREEKSPCRDIPTEALRIHLEMMDGQEVGNDHQLGFLNACRFEWQWRDKL